MDLRVAWAKLDREWSLPRVEGRRMFGAWQETAKPPGRALSGRCRPAAGLGLLALLLTAVSGPRQRMLSAP